MKVRIPSPLHSYTDGRTDLQGEGETLAELLVYLDLLHPGLRFRIIDEQDRIRPHIRLFVAGKLATGLAHPIGPDDEIRIVCALSGG